MVSSVQPSTNAAYFAPSPGVSHGRPLKNDLQTKKITTFAKTGDPWRVIAGPGLNIEAECRNRLCNAHKKKVWTVPQNEYDTCFGNINLLQRVNRIVCPICKRNTPPDTVYSIGFYNCNYLFDGKLRDTNGQGQFVVSGRPPKPDDGTEPPPSPIEEEVNVKNGFIQYMGSEVFTLWEYVEIRVRPL